MTLFNLLKTALRGLTANKLRAALTALGVIIGVASVIATLAPGNGEAHTPKPPLSKIVSPR